MRLQEWLIWYTVWLPWLVIYWVAYCWVAKCWVQLTHFALAAAHRAGHRLHTGCSTWWYTNDPQPARPHLLVMIRAGRCTAAAAAGAGSTAGCSREREGTRARGGPRGRGRCRAQAAGGGSRAGCATCGLLQAPRVGGSATGVSGSSCCGMEWNGME